MRARCRDEVRNNPYAASAVDNFEAHCVGEGIFPHWNIDNEPLKAEIEEKFDKWARRTEFYLKQATAAREIFEAGEVFCRFHSRPSSWSLSVPLDIELIEGEQVPVFLNQMQAGQLSPSSSSNTIRTGIEFDPDKRIAAYHMYREHPGETMFYSLTGLQFVRIPASEVLHAFKPLRAGLLRGQPHLASALVLLHEIGKYTDAAIVKKQIQTMFAGFVKKTAPDADIIPIDTTAVSAPVVPPSLPFGVSLSTIETGTLQELFPGEDIVFPSLPQDNDIETFLSVCLHQFAASIGATYEQITGDLRGVNLSSIRYGVQCAERKMYHFQRFVLICQLLQPIVKRWLKEAVLAGELVLPFYARRPELYENVAWRTPGSKFMDPLVDAQAAVLRIRAGLSSREEEASLIGADAATIDKQQAIDNKRADGMGLIHDSDGRKVLPKGTKLTADGEEDAGGVAGIKPRDSETPSETAKLSPKPPPPPPPPPAAAPKPRGSPRPNGRA
jgi:lambda family phage portal protein